MKKTLNGLAVAVWVFCCVLSLAAPAAFGESPSTDSARESELKAVHDDVARQIREREIEYEREQEKLKKTKKDAVDLSKKERRLLKKLEAAEKVLTQTRRDLAVLTVQLDALKEDIRKTHEAWSSENAALAYRRILLSSRLRSLYLSGPRPELLSDVFYFGDIGRAYQMRAGLVHAASRDRRLARQIGARKEEIEKYQTLLSAKEKNLMAVQDKKYQVEKRQAAERQKRKEILDEVRGRKSALEEMARRIEEESANMKLLMTTLRERLLNLKEQLAYLKKEFEDKKGLLRWPVDAAAIRTVRPYGKFFDESIKSSRINKGIDIVTENNQSVQAVSRGEVVFSDFFGRMGNLVIIAHGGDYFTLYAHLAEIGVGLGRRIEAGETIGRAGNTGLLEEGTLLHFEVRQGSQAVDPQDWLRRR